MAGQVVPGPFASGLSECSESYLRAISHPFGDFPEPPCIPDMITIPSFKVTAVCRGSFTIGSGTVGWVVIDPFKLIWNDGSFAGSNVSYPVLYTTSSFGGTTYSWSVSGGAPTTGVTGANSSSLFNQAALTGAAGKQVEYRLVGAGLRIAYCGTELNRGGRVIMYRSRDNESLTLPYTAADFLKDPTSHFSQVQRNWETVTYIPAHPNKAGYATKGSYNVSDGGVDHYNLIGYVDGAVAGQSFVFEAVGLFELIGSSFPGTSSHSDPIGYGAIMSSIPQNLLEGGNQMFNSMRQGAFRALEMSATGLLSAASTAGATAAGIALSRNRRQRRLTYSNV